MVIRAWIARSFCHDTGLPARFRLEGLPFPSLYEGSHKIPNELCRRLIFRLGRRHEGSLQARVDPKIEGLILRVLAGSCHDRRLSAVQITYNMCLHYTAGNLASMKNPTISHGRFYEGARPLRRSTVPRRPWRAMSSVPPLGQAPGSSRRVYRKCPMLEIAKTKKRRSEGGGPPLTRASWSGPRGVTLKSRGAPPALTRRVTVAMRSGRRQAENAANL